MKCATGFCRTGQPAMALLRTRADGEPIIPPQLACAACAVWANSYGPLVRMELLPPRLRDLGPEWTVVESGGLLRPIARDQDLVFEEVT